MAMEFKLNIQDAHAKPILCIAINHLRREIYTGSEDNTIKIWETENGKLLNTINEHKGPVTTLCYIKEIKLLFSGSIDGCLCVWGNNGKLIQKIENKAPIYSMAYLSRRQQLIVGFNGKVRVFQIQINDDSPLSGEVIENRSYTCAEHSDIVKCVLSCEGRFYSAGYDRKIVIYNTPSHSDMRLRVVNTVYNAHDAAISAMIYAKDAENSWIITGSFDRVVKLWSLDGVLLQKFEGLGDTIASLCFVQTTQSLWIMMNSLSPVIYDPKSGSNITDFVTDDHIYDYKLTDVRGRLLIRHVAYNAETNDMVGFTNRKGVTTWKYNPHANVSVLSGHTDIIESLACTGSEPHLIFSGGVDGIIRRWERTQMNAFMYSQEHILPHLNADFDYEADGDQHVFRSTLHPNPEIRRKLQVALRKHIQHKLRDWSAPSYNASDKRGRQLKFSEMMNQDIKLMSETVRENFYVQERRLEYGARKLGVFLHPMGQPTRHVSTNFFKTTHLCAMYHDRLDYLITGSDDGRLFVWGYNSSGDGQAGGPSTSVAADVPESDETSTTTTTNQKDVVSNRVAGLTQKMVMREHKDAITSVFCARYNDEDYLVSTGWDRRIVIWRLSDGSVEDVFRTSTNASVHSREEMAADGPILDMDYVAGRNEFAYASADKCAYIRQFSIDGSKMTLRAVLQGHEEEVTCIKWNHIHNQWITGSEDKTIRIWAAEGIPCVKVIDNGGTVTALCVDMLNGCIVSGSQDRIIRVYDLSRNVEVVQKNVGHTDSIRSIIHIPARHQYVSASWDQTVRVWNAHRKKGPIRHADNSNASLARESIAVEEIKMMNEAMKRVSFQVQTNKIIEE